jgi:hypothetical protein
LGDGSFPSGGAVTPTVLSESLHLTAPSFCILEKRGIVEMDMKDVMNHVREDLRERPDSHFAEIYFRTVKHGASGAEVRQAITEILKRDEVRIKDGKWRLIAPVERRRVA